MTREKAIEILKQRECCRECVVDIGDCNDCDKAFEMAIKALEQEPCEDAVSRANLLKKFEDRFVELQKAHQTDKQLGVNWCINTLKDMPP